MVCCGNALSIRQSRKVSRMTQFSQIANLVFTK